MLPTNGLARAAAKARALPSCRPIAGTLNDFDILHRALSKGSRTRAVISGTRDAFTVSWDGVPVFRVAHGRDVFAIRIPEGEGASLALRRLIETVARCYGLGFALNMNAPRGEGRAPGRVFLHIAETGSFKVVPGVWKVWHRRAGRVRPSTSDDFGLTDRMAALAALYPPRPIIASTRPERVTA